MNNKEKRRIERYQNSTGLARAWDYAVIALTMGNVELALDRYEEERREPVLIVDEKVEEANLDVLTNAVLETSFEAPPEKRGCPFS